MHTPTSNSQKLRSFKFLSLGFAGIALSLSSAYADTQWNGTVSSDPANSANYSGTVPTYGSSNSGNLTIANGITGSAMAYSSSQGATSFTGNIRVGVDSSNNAASSSTLGVNGGTLTINSSGTSTIGYQGSGTINVSGGTFAVNGSDQFWFGNTFAATANVSGGTFIAGDQFLFSRQGGTSIINLSGNGVFNVTNSGGTQYNANTGNGFATINLSGNSIFEQTGSSTISLNGGTNFNINFTSGSSATFALLGSSTSSLQSLVSSGLVQINGADDTNFSSYIITGAADGSSLGTIQLASAIPEPSTYAMMFGGVAMLFALKRIKRTRSALKVG